LRLDAIVPPAVRPLETVRAEIAAAWKAERQAEIAEKKSAEMVAKVKGGAALEDVAKEFGAALYVSKEFLRTGEGLEKILPASLIVDLFKIRRGETVAASGNDAEFVARLKDIAGPEAGAAEGGALNALRRELDAGIANDLAEQLYAALRRRVGVEIDRTALERAY
jgi:peptidyl-prolyl cis-trans isomerase D